MGPQGSKQNALYYPLGQTEQCFRIIELMPLEPGDTEETIRCRLCTKRLDDSPPYEALSYCWGDASLRKDIICNNNIFSITQNLYLALQHLRPFSRNRVLWIDAICINQEDLAERSSQVSIMDRIYREAQRTIVWLGPQSENSNLAFSYFERVVEKSPQSIYDIMTRSRQRYRARPTRTVPFWYQICEREVHERDETWEPWTSNPLRKEYKAITDILDRPWFTRSWIIQEVYLAREVIVQCGHDEVDIDYFATGLHIALNTRLYDRDGYHPGYHLMQKAADVIAQRSFSPSGDILNTLLSHRSMNATDLRDKVYAFQALIEKSADGQLLIEPNYKSTKRECYCATARAILLQKKNLDCLLVDRPANVPEESPLPSWVPDWSSNPKLLSLLPERWMEKSWDARPCSFWACGLSRVYDPTFRRGDIIVLSGYTPDSISELTEQTVPFEGDELDFELINLTRNLSPREALDSFINLISFMGRNVDRMMEWERFAKGRGSPYLSTEDRVSVFGALLTAGVEVRNRQHTRKCFLNWRRMFFFPRMIWWMKSLGVHRMRVLGPLFYVSLLFLSFLMMWGDSSNFHEWIRVTEGRRLAKTENGCIALVPGESRVGDRVALCKGGRFPFILRNNGQLWEIVGYAYVHGWMMGEMWDESKCIELEIS